MAVGTDTIDAGDCKRLWAGARRLAVIAAVMVLILFVVFVINQVAQVVDLADRVSPRFGTIVLRALIVILVILLPAPVVMHLRLAPPLRPPADDTGPEFEEHLDAPRTRLHASKATGAPANLFRFGRKGDDGTTDKSPDDPE